MSSIADQLIAYAQTKHLSSHTVQRWQAWSVEDQAALLSVATVLQLNDNQLRDFLDWCDEIVARDRVPVRDVIGRAEVQQPLTSALSRNDKLKGVKEALRRLRYPRLSQLEDNVRAAIKALDLGDRVRVSSPPTLEGNDLTITMTARNSRELQDQLMQIQQKLADGSLQQVFALLDEV